MHKHFTYGDKSVDSFYEDVESAMNKVSSQYTTVTGEKQVGERAVRNSKINMANVMSRWICGEKQSEDNEYTLLQTNEKKMLIDKVKLKIK